MKSAELYHQVQFEDMSLLKSAVGFLQFSKRFVKIKSFVYFFVVAATFALSFAIDRL
jgi:hypothetical protein